MIDDDETERETRVRGYLDQGYLISEIARKEGVSRQSMWEWCARRRLLPDEQQARYSRTLAEKEQRKRKRLKADREARRVAD